MKAAAVPLQKQSQSVCQLCDYALQHLAQRRSFVTASTPPVRLLVPARHGSLSRLSTRAITITKPIRGLHSGVRAASESDQQRWGSRMAALKAKLIEVEKHIQWIKSSPRVESEAATLEALEGLEDVARQAIAVRTRQPLPAKTDIKQSSANAVLSMGRDEDGVASVEGPRAKQAPFLDIPSPSYLSGLALNLVKHPKVFLSPSVLALYISFQRLVACPRTIPEVLYLYAHKPVPELGSSPPKFSKPSPKSAKQAIPPKLADEALTAAIEAKDMPLALDVVETSYRAPAWRRHRIIAKLGVPGVVAAITPLALYTLAQELSEYSGYADPWMFKVYSFMGMSTYILCTGTLGFVALTTYNDNHIRVVWRPGVPLLDRYLREDERAAMDRIACAWGFKEEWRRGDEEGEEWEGLRQLILLRGMILDKPELMPGMNP